MPICPQCNNRSFTTKEGLRQHMKTSSAFHPFCGICDRRFIDEIGYNAHMAAKHPPTYDCDACSRSYHAPFALEDHYRGSRAHPNCSQCGRGFKDAQACEEHHRTSHPRVLCVPCGITMYEEHLDKHHMESQKHPSCLSCQRGFKDDGTYTEHIGLVHPELRCDPCGLHFEATEAVTEHLDMSSIHPKCASCNVGFKDDTKYLEHLASQHPSPPVPPPPEVESKSNSAPEQTSEPPLSSFSLLKKPFKNLIANENFGDMSSPILSMHMSYASPIKEVQAPLFSPSLPRPGKEIDEVWASLDNVQTRGLRSSDMMLASKNAPLPIAPPSAALIPDTHTDYIHQLQSWRPKGTALQSVTIPAFSPQSPQMYSTPSTESRYSQRSQMFSGRLLDERFEGPFFPRETRSSPPSGTPKHSPTTSPTNNLVPLSPPASSTSTRSDKGKSPEKNSSKEIKGPLGSSPGHRLGYFPINLSWRSLPLTREPKRINTGGDSESSDLLITRYVGSSLPPAGSGFSTFDTGHLPLDFDGLSTAPSSASDNRFSPWSAQPHDTGPFTAPSLGSQSALSSGSDPSSPLRASSGSPEVFSPIGLAVLPIISPLPATPVDLSGAQEPHAMIDMTLTPVESPRSVSTGILEAHLPPSTSSLSTPQSYTTSPQDISGEFTFRDDEILATRLPDSDRSPSSSGRSSPALYYSSSPTKSWKDSKEVEEKEFDAGEKSLDKEVLELNVEEETVVVNAPELMKRVPTASSPTTENSIASSISSLSAALPSNPLHCRLCQAETCQDMTATMCGHLFCNRCITEAVIKTSRCPRCATPTLLYCLFRIDLSL